jgi:hypothetical protein
MAPNNTISISSTRKLYACCECRELCRSGKQLLPPRPPPPAVAKNVYIDPCPAACMQPITDSHRKRDVLIHSERLSGRRRINDAMSTQTIDQRTSESDISCMRPPTAVARHINDTSNLAYRMVRYRMLSDSHWVYVDVHASQKLAAGVK